MQQRIVRVYGPWIKVTLAEPSASIVIRSEHQYNKQERPRLSLRKHFYELERGDPFLVVEKALRDLTRAEVTKDTSLCQKLKGLEGRPFERTEELLRQLNLPLQDPVVAAGLPHAVPAFSALGCHPLELGVAGNGERRGDAFGRYLGFVDLRLNSTVSPLAMGLLVPPRRYRDDPNAFVMTGEYGPLFGAPGFASTLYSMHEPETGGAACAEACLIMALGVLSDRGVSLEGSHTLTYLAKHRNLQTSNRIHQPTCQLDLEAVQGAFRADKGLCPDECFKVLNSFPGVNAAHLRLPRLLYPPRLAFRLILAYVLARLPVILFVETRHWWGKLARETGGHAVVVVGGRRLSPLPNDWTLLTHDPGHLPFYEMTIEEAALAAWAYPRADRTSRPPESQVMILAAAADEGVRQHAHACLRVLLRDEASRARLAPFLYTPDGDLAIRLLHRDDILHAVFRRQEWLDDDWRRVESAFSAKVPRARYWCFLGYASRRLEIAWLFNAEDHGPLQHWRLRFLRPDGPEGPIKVRLTGIMNPTRPSPDPGKARPTAGRPTVPPLPHEPLPFRSWWQRVKERVGQAAPLLAPSVMTSSSIRDLPELFAELKSIHHLQLVDLMLLRDTDIENLMRDLERRGRHLYITSDLSHRVLPDVPTGPVPRFDVTQILSVDANVRAIADWLLRQCGPPNRMRVAALATYLPDVTSWDRERRNLAIDALANAVSIALTLRDRKIMQEAIVEMVCGSLVDTCGCNGARGWSNVTSPEVKIARLLDSLEEIVARVKKRRGAGWGGKGHRFALALELEPGSTYVLRDLESIRLITEELRRRPALTAHVGLNLDIAHMKIAKISPVDLAPYRDLFLHSHICDHPGMHTRDQPVGTWTAVEQRRGDYRGYMELLWRRAHRAPKGGLPFSGAFALELEGCNRIGWIHRSLSAMRHLVAQADDPRRRGAPATTQG